MVSYHYHLFDLLTRVGATEGDPFGLGGMSLMTPPPSK